MVAAPPRRGTRSGVRRVETSFALSKASVIPLGRSTASARSQTDAASATRARSAASSRRAVARARASAARAVWSAATRCFAPAYLRGRPHRVGGGEQHPSSAERLRGRPKRRRASSSRIEGPARTVFSATRALVRVVGDGGGLHDDEFVDAPLQPAGGFEPRAGLGDADAARPRVRRERALEVVRGSERRDPELVRRQRHPRGVDQVGRNAPGRRRPAAPPRQQAAASDLKVAAATPKWVVGISRVHQTAPRGPRVPAERDVAPSAQPHERLARAVRPAVDARFQRGGARPSAPATPGVDDDGIVRRIERRLELARLRRVARDVDAAVLPEAAAPRLDRFKRRRLAVGVVRVVARGLERRVRRERHLSRIRVAEVRRRPRKPRRGAAAGGGRDPTVRRDPRKTRACALDDGAAARRRSSGDAARDDDAVAETTDRSVEPRPLDEAAFPRTRRAKNVFSKGRRFPRGAATSVRNKRRTAAAGVGGACRGQRSSKRRRLLGSRDARSERFATCGFL